MTAISALGYLEIGASDLDAWRRYATEILGLACATDDDGALLLRLDDSIWRLRVTENEADDIRCAGFEVASAADLDTLAQRLKAMDIPARNGSAEECAARGVQALLNCSDPDGLAVELFCARDTAAEPFISPRGLTFVTGDQGLGHIVLMVEDQAAARRFYEEGLGFRVSDFITMGTPPKSIDLTFLHCNPRHHTLALAPIPMAPKRLNHVMLQVNALDAVGTTFDLVRDQQVPVSMGLGKHTNDHMLSFYMQTPSGFDLEFGFGARTVDDATWSVEHYDSGSEWGHRRAG